MTTEAIYQPPSLANRTIIITRAREQAAEFIKELEREGARVISCPTIEIVEPESYAPLDEAIKNLYGYDWIIFTSANGVDRFIRRLSVHGLDVSEMDDLRVCAIGDATAVSLREASVHVDVVPQEFKAEGVFAALESYVGGSANLAGLNFLLPCAAVARKYLPHALREAGARVDVVPVYRTVRPESTERGRIAALLAGGAIDCIAFTSSSTVTNFAALFDVTSLRELLDNIHIACIGDITASTAAGLGLQTHIQPRESTVNALARAISAYYEKQT